MVYCKASGTDHIGDVNGFLGSGAASCKHFSRCVANPALQPAEVELAVVGKVIRAVIGWVSVLTVFSGNLSNRESWLLLAETCRA